MNQIWNLPKSKKRLIDTLSDFCVSQSLLEASSMPDDEVEIIAQALENIWENTQRFQEIIDFILTLKPWETRINLGIMCSIKADTLFQKEVLADLSIYKKIQEIVQNIDWVTLH